MKVTESNISLDTDILPCKAEVEELISHYNRRDVLDKMEPAPEGAVGIYLWFSTSAKYLDHVCNKVTVTCSAKYLAENGLGRTAWPTTWDVVGSFRAWHTPFDRDELIVYGGSGDECVSPKEYPMPKAVVVTRHPALVQLLRERGLIEEACSITAHATTDQIRGKHVFGVLPLELAAEAALVTTIPLSLAPEDRGKELGIERLREIAGEPRTFVVTGA